MHKFADWNYYGCFMKYMKCVQYDKQTHDLKPKPTTAAFIWKVEKFMMKEIKCVG